MFLGRLRHSVRAVKQENSNLLVGLPHDVDPPMNAVARFFPIDPSRGDFNALALAAVALFD